MEEKAKIICRSNFKNTDKTVVTAELTEKVAKLIRRIENSSSSQTEPPSSPPKR